MTRNVRACREVVRFELHYQCRRPATWIFVGVFLLALVGHLYGQLAHAEVGALRFGTPLTLAHTATAMTLVAALVIAPIAGDAATRDIHLRMEALMHASPHGPHAYLLGRVLGVLALMIILLAFVPVAATVLPWLQSGPAAIPTHPHAATAHVLICLAILLPNAVVVTALLFALAAGVRHPLAAWIGALLVMAASLFSTHIVGGVMGHWTLATFLDPTGSTAVHLMTQTWSPLDVEARLVGVQASLLVHRAVWITLACSALAFVCARFGFVGSSTTDRSRGLAGPDGTADAIIADRPDGTLQRATPTRTTVTVSARRMHALQVVAVLRDSLREVVTGWTWLVIPGVVLLLLTVPSMLGHLGVPYVATTDRVLAILRGPVSDLRILIILLAGELVWRERDANVQGLADTAPVPNVVWFIGKLLGLWGVTLALHAVLLTAGVLIQLSRGVVHIDWALYVQVVFGLTLVRTLSFGLLALSVHVLVNHKHVAHLLLLLLVMALNGAAAQMGIEHPLLLYGATSGWRYSRISGFDPFLWPVLLFELYWTAWTVVVALLAQLFWVRGVAQGLRDRTRIARQRVTPTFVGGMAVSCVFVLLAAAVIFYNTNVLNASRTDHAVAGRRARYEHRYKRFERIPQPAVSSTVLDIELYPDDYLANVRGVFTLTNRTTAPLSMIHVTTSDKVDSEEITFERPVRLVEHDPDLGYHVYELATPMAPGSDVRMAWKARHARRGFGTHGPVTDVVKNGTVAVMHEWMPSVGYRSWTELTDDAQRREHGLPERLPNVRLEDVGARYDTSGQERSMVTATVATASDQIAVAPGSLRRSWTRNDRRYFEYVTHAPIGPGYAVFSARYARQTERAGSVALEVLHHPAHTLNVARMLRAMQASLQQYQQRFGVYPHDVLRMVEYPSSGGGLHAATSNIWYQELFSLLDAKADPRDIDVPFAVVAHEVAHQFQPALARVEGRALLSEAFAWYAAFGVVEQEYGADHLQRLLGMMRQAYQAPRTRAGTPLLRGVDDFDAYRKGPFALYALQQYIGRDRLDLAWRRLLDAHRSGVPPLATSLDLYRELRAVTPVTLHPLLRDLFERNTFWQLATDRVSIEPNGVGRWRVTLDITARKVVVDEQGRETAKAMDDPVEIGFYPAKSGTAGVRPSHLQLHRLRSGAQQIVIDVPDKPVAVVLDPRHLLTAPRYDGQ